MNLKQLQSVINKAVEQADGYDAAVEVWLDGSCYEIERVSQFGIIPDVSITLKTNATMTLKNDKPSDCCSCSDCCSA